MPVKRAPLVSTATKPRPSYGQPYQIYSEVANVGKNVEGSKRRVKWRFGWSDTDREFEVEFIHSLVTGKKTVLEDGKEITTSTSLLATEFGHSWNSENSLHIFRVEANLSMTSEHTYMFLIDGQRFIDMPRKPLNGRKSYVDGSDFAQKSPANSNTNRRGSTGTIPERGTFQSPRDNEIKTFDPFEDSSDDTFRSSQTNNNSANSNNNNNANKKKSSNDTQNKPPVTAQVGNLLEDFDESPHTHQKKSQGFDAFGEFPTNFNSSFAGANSSGVSPPGTKSNNLSKTGNDFLTGNTGKSDGFGNFSQSDFDPFGSSHHPTNKKSSAQDIMHDLEGLTIAPVSVTASVSSSSSSVTASSVAVEEDNDNQSQVSSAQTALVPYNETPDTWGNNLVNLDLTTYGSRPKTIEKPISTTAPKVSLGNKPIMNAPPPQIVPTSVMIVPISPIGGNPTLIGNNFGATPGYGSATNMIAPSTFGTMPPSQPMGMGRPTFGNTGGNSNMSMNTTGFSNASTPPINPFSGGLSMSSNTSNVTRGIPSNKSGPIDPFQTLPGLQNPSFHSNATAPKTYESVAPLSAMASKSTISSSGAISNNGMKSTPFAQKTQPLPGTSLDSLSWRPS